MKIGTADVDALSLGSTTIDKVYLGTDVVWQTAAGPNWNMSGDISTFASRAASLTNIIQGGEVSNFTNYSSNPIRTNGTNTYTEFIFRVPGWTTGNNFVASTSTRTYGFTINGLIPPHSSVSEVTNANNNLCRVRFFGTSAAIGAFWTANVATGNAVEFSVTYT